MPGHGFQTQDGEFLIGVNHAVGMQDFTWGMWTIVLTGMAGYVNAYPGWDFMFEVEVMEPWDIKGLNVAAGFAMTRA